MSKKALGRPTDYTSELADTICERLANGESLVTICKDDTMPSRTAVHEWLNEKSPVFKQDFLNNYARAREDQADYKADEIEDIADKVLSGEVRPDAARVAIDAKKWTASKLRPKRYGDKIDMTSGGDKIETNTIVFTDFRHDTKSK